MKGYADYRGLEGFVAAEITANTGDSYATGNWRQLEGAVSASVEGGESSAPIYRDNKPVRNITTEGADTATLNMDVLANKVRAWLEGRTYSEANDVYIKTPKKFKEFALGFIGTKTDGSKEAVIMYCTTVTGGNEERNTADDGTDVTTVEYVFTGVFTQKHFDCGGTESEPVKSLIIPLSGTVTAEKIFGTFTDGESTLDVLTPEEVIALA